MTFFLSIFPLIMKGNIHCLIYLVLTFFLFGTILTAQVNDRGESVQEKPLFSFVLIADIQYADAPTSGLRNYRGALSKLEVAVPKINELDPEFVITLGDNIDRDYESFDKVLPLLSQIQAPLYNAIGNHDFTVDDQFKPLIRQHLNNEQGYFSFTRKGYRFVILDGTDLSTIAHKKGTSEYRKGLDNLQKLKAAGVNNAHDWNGGFGQDQMRWLENELTEADHARQKVLLFCHWPLWPEIGTQLWNNKEVLAMLERHPSVLAWISGHHHAGGYHLHKGVHHLTLKGMVESKTATSFGIMNVYDNGVELKGVGDQLNVIMRSVNDSTQNLLPTHPYHSMRSGLPNAYAKFTKTGKGRVAFLGGSITYNHGWRDSVMQYLERRFPDTEFDFIAAGIPSMGTTPAAFRLQRDVLKYGPIDLLFEEAAVNDASNGRTNEEQVRGMEGIFRHIRYVNPTADIVLMHFVDPDKMEDYRNKKSPQVILNHEKVANHYNIPTINLAKEVTDRIDAREFTWKDDFINLHPSPFGQGVYARSIIDFLEASWKEASDDQKIIQNYSLPDKLDLFCYDQGKLIEVHSKMETNSWRYVRSWVPDDKAGTRSNYTNVPMLVNDSPGQILTYTFKGRGAGIAVAAGPDAGIIEYRIDEGKWKEQDLFTRWSSGLHLPWYYTLAPELSEGHHKLEIRIKPHHNPESTGTVARIRYFYVNK